MQTMPKKNPKEPTKGRPPTNPPELNKRYMIRTSKEALGRWEALAEFQNLGNASTLVRKTMNDKYRKAIDDMSPADRKAVEARAAELLSRMADD